MQNVTLTDKQQVSAGITILDQDGQPFASVPPGANVTFSTSDPEVAPITVAADGLNINVTSGKVGHATITASASLADGTTLGDTLEVDVVNSTPGSLNFTVGTPTDE